MLRPTDPRLVGITGGTGAGKSELSRMLAQNESWPLLEADRFGHAALLPGSTPYRRVLARFGAAVVGPGGGVDRRRLAGVVFSDPAALADLNDITHPWIVERLLEELARLRAAGYADIILLDAALLHLWRERIRPRWIVVVVAPLRRRLERLAASGMTRAEALRRMRSQGRGPARQDRADWVVENGGSRAELAAEARRLAERIRAAGVSRGTQARGGKNGSGSGQDG